VNKRVSCLENQNFSIAAEIDRLFESWTFAILCIALLITGLFVFKDYLLFKKLYLFKDIGSDTINLFYPHLMHISDYVRHEGIPRWSFNQGMGQNIFPGGIEDPFTLMLIALGKQYMAYGIAYVEFLKVFLAGIVFYLYLRVLDLGRYTSLLGALLFAFSGYMILGTGWWANHSLFVLHGAFLLFAFEKLFRQDSRKWFPLAVAVVAGPKIFFYAEFLLLYSVFRSIDEYGVRIKKFLCLIFKLSWLGLLGLAISSFFLIGNVLQALQSPRVAGQASYAHILASTPIFFLEKPLHYSTVIMRLFSNDLLGAGNAYQGWYTYLEAPCFYCGLLTLLLFPQVFGSLDKKRKITYLLFISFWVLLIIFPHFRYAFYLYEGDYYKNGLSLFVPITLLFFALHALNKADNNRGLSLKLLFATSIILVFALYYPYFLRPSPVDPALRRITALFLVIYTVLLFLSNRTRYRRLFMYLILITVCLELWHSSYITVNRRSVVTSVEYRLRTGYNDFTTDAVKYLKARDSGFYRINKDYTSGTAMHASLNDAKAQGYYGTSSFSSFNQKYYIKFLQEMDIIDRHNEIQTRWSSGLTASPILQTLASTKYQLVKYTPDDFIRATYAILAQKGDVTILENRYFLPLGFTYDSYITPDEFQALTKQQRQTVLFNAFVIENPTRDLTTGFSRYDTGSMPNEYSTRQYAKDITERKKWHLNIMEHNQNHIKGTIRIPRKEMLFFSIPYDTGWQAMVDGKKVKPALVNIGFMGLPIGPGDHVVELEYKVPYFLASLLISVFALIIYFLTVFV